VRVFGGTGRLTVVVDIKDAVRASSKASLHDSVVLLEEGRVECAAQSIGHKILPTSRNTEDVLRARSVYRTDFFFC